MDKFFEKYNFPKVTQEEVDNWNSHITVKYIEFVIIIKNFSQRKLKAQTVSLVNSIMHKVRNNTNHI